jgi:HEAT repeats/SIR2-like domain
MTHNPISFLLGAGASYPFGVPMMAGFYREFREHLERRHRHCFGLLQKFEQNAPHANVDLESLLTDLNSILGVERGLALVGGNQSPIREEISVARELRGYLDAFVVDRCERFNREKAGSELATILALRQYGPVWIFSTNYDRIVEFACQANSVPCSDGFEIDPAEAVANWTGKFETDVRVVKLHGSVNWYEDDPGGALHRLDRGYSLPAHDFRLLRGDQRLRPLMIIPTLEKEAMTAPYIGLAMQFTDVLKSTRILIVAGNSLRDRHIKEYIRARLSGLHVLLVSPTADQQKHIFDDATRTHTLAAGFSEFLTIGGDALRRLAAAASAASNDEEVGAAIEQLITVMSGDINDDAAVAANPALHRIWRKLEGKQAPDRVAAVKELAGHSHPAILRRLRAILSDPNPGVRIAAIDSLTRMAGREAIASLASLLETESETDVLVECALALMHIGMDSTIRAALEKSLARPETPAVLRKIIQTGLARSSVASGS